MKGLSAEGPAGRDWNLIVTTASRAGVARRSTKLRIVPWLWLTCTMGFARFAEEIAPWLNANDKAVRSRICVVHALQ